MNEQVKQIDDIGPVRHIHTHIDTHMHTEIYTLTHTQRPYYEKLKGLDKTHSQHTHTHYYANPHRSLHRNCTHTHTYTHTPYIEAIHIHRH